MSTLYNAQDALQVEVQFVVKITFNPRLEQVNNCILTHIQLFHLKYLCFHKCSFQIWNSYNFSSIQKRPLANREAFHLEKVLNKKTIQIKSDVILKSQNWISWNTVKSLTTGLRRPSRYKELVTKSGYEGLYID